MYRRHGGLGVGDVDGLESHNIASHFTTLEVGRTIMHHISPNGLSVAVAMGRVLESLNPTSYALHLRLASMWDAIVRAMTPQEEDLLTSALNRINNFATKGCTVVCHVPKGAPNAKDGKFGTSTGAEKGDLWHWKGARSDPAGVADDTWVTMISEKKGGRKGDAGSGGDKKNITADKSKPMYTLAPGKKLGKHGILLAADAVEIADYSVFQAGDVVTYRMPKTAAGSRGDIKAVSSYGYGGWTVMLHRKLDTGNDDDTAFNPRKKYSFTMALFDNSGDEDSYDSEVMTLQFKK